MPSDFLSHEAILADSAPRLRAQGAAVTLRIWHHLASDEAHLLLFEQFRSDGHAYPLIEAMLVAAADPAAVFKIALPPGQIRGGSAALVQALAEAISDIFGAADRDQVAAAWAALLGQLLERSAQRGERQTR